jgi:hypothetical protein
MGITAKDTPVGLAVVGLAVVGLAVVGLAVVGWAVVGLAVVGAAVGVAAHRASCQARTHTQNVGSGEHAQCPRDSQVSHPNAHHTPVQKTPLVRMHTYTVRYKLRFTRSHMVHTRVRTRGPGGGRCRRRRRHDARRLGAGARARLRPDAAEAAVKVAARQLVTAAAAALTTAGAHGAAGGLGLQRELLAASVARQNAP